MKAVFGSLIFYSQNVPDPLGSLENWTELSNVNGSCEANLITIYCIYCVWVWYFEWCLLDFPREIR